MTDETNVSRRKFLGQTAAAAAAVGLAQTPIKASANTAAPGKAKRPPNFLFIMADDMGWADLSCYGRREYETPVIDKLARQGIRLTQAYSNSPVCSATRIAFNTVRYQQKIPVGTQEPVYYRKDMAAAGLLHTMGIPPSHPTIASLLGDAGYHTALYGKWHAGYLPTFGPTKSGYQEFLGFLSGGVDHFTHEDWYGELDLWEDEIKVDKIGYSTNLLTDRALEFIRRQSASKPFFLNLSYTAPHWPFEGPNDENKVNHDKKLIDPDYKYVIAAGHPRGLAAFNQGDERTYAEMVRNLDASVGKVLDALEQSGLADNTIVVFTSDNGGERFSDTWPFVGAKGHLYEGGIRVPGIIRWPGKLPSNKVNTQQVVTTFDWAATVLTAANVEPAPNKPWDGIDVHPYLETTGSSKEKVLPRSLFWRYSGQAAARIGDYKYLRFRKTENIIKLSDMATYMLGDSDGPNDNSWPLEKPEETYEYLFDLSKDQREQHNLIWDPNYADKANQLKQAYYDWSETVLPEQSKSKLADGSDVPYPD